MILKIVRFLLCTIAVFGYSSLKRSHNRGWAWTCDELENIHSEIQDNYGLSYHKCSLKSYK